MRDQVERQRRRAAGGHATREEELVETRRTDIQQTEAITPRRDFKERLDRAIHQELIAQDAIEVEQVEDQFAGRNHRPCQRTAAEYRTAESWARRNPVSSLPVSN